MPGSISNLNRSKWGDELTVSGENLRYERMHVVVNVFIMQTCSYERVHNVFTIPGVVLQGSSASTPAGRRPAPRPPARPRGGIHTDEKRRSKLMRPINERWISGEELQTASGIGDILVEAFAGVVPGNLSCSEQFLPTGSSRQVPLPSRKGGCPAGRAPQRAHAAVRQR